MQLLLVTDIAFIIIAAAVLGYIARLLKQPLIISYILAGVIIGPFGLNFIGNETTILSISELGITFLLFLVGMELNINKVKEVGKVVLIGGLIQIALTAAFTAAIAHFIGFSLIESFYVSIVLSFSSTLVIVKHLSDKREIDSLHGRIIVGTLVLQDIIAIMAISILPTLGDFNLVAVGYSALSGISLMALAYILSRFVLGRIFDFSAKDGELLFLSSLAVCFVFAYLATLMGFSMTIGAFLAGVIIANLPYSLDVIEKIKSLTTFFSALFFVTLGMQIVPNTLPEILLPLLILTGIAVIMKPLIIYPIVYLFGYHKKTSFLTAISMGQVSEFSLIIVAEGILLKHLTPDILSLIITLTVVSMAISTYFLNTATSLYNKYEQYLGFIDKLFKRKNTEFLENDETYQQINVVVNGYANVEGSMVEKFMNAGKKVLIIDNDPDVIRKLKETKMNCMYGDLAENNIFDKIDMKKVEIIMSTTPDYHGNMSIIKRVREMNKKAIIIVNANRVDESFDLYNVGADYVVIPHIEGEKHAAVLLEDFNNDISKVLPNKIKHIEQLRKRQSMKNQMYNGNGSFFTDIDNFLKETGKKIVETSSFINHGSKKKQKTSHEAAEMNLNHISSEDGKKTAQQES